MIRQSLRLYHEGGIAPSFGWDIIVGNEDYYGEELPDSIHSVVILTEEIPNRTLWVEYRAADQADGFLNPGIRREIVNPVPMFAKKSSGDGTFKPVRQTDDSYAVELRP